MPVKVFDLLPSTLNTSNDVSPSGFQNIRTLQQTNAGGLTLGDAIDLTDFEAASQSSASIGILYQGRYRRVQVDANATAANVARGKAAYVVPGYSLLGVLILTAGSGQTAGTYQVSGTGGGGSGAIIQVVVASGGTVTAAPTIVAAGSGYTSAPTFTLAAGGTAATFQPQMVLNSYIVTSRDVTGANLSQGRGVFLNSITPGNYGWIQENGIATVLQTTTVTSATVGANVSPATPTDGTFQATAATAAPLASAFGTAVDAPIASTYYRTNLTLPIWNG
jgi:hypothetical protein